MLKQVNLPEKAKDLTLIAVICDALNFKDIIKAFEYADEKHKRYTLFKHVSHHEQIRGQRWDGYLKMSTSQTIEREMHNLLDELRSRGVRKLTVTQTENGPIIQKFEVIS